MKNFLAASFVLLSSCSRYFGEPAGRDRKPLVRPDGGVLDALLEDSAFAEVGADGILVSASGDYISSIGERGLMPVGSLGAIGYRYVRYRASSARRGGGTSFFTEFCGSLEDGSAFALTRCGYRSLCPPGSGCSCGRTVRRSSYADCREPGTDVFYRYRVGDGGYVREDDGGRLLGADGIMGDLRRLGAGAVDFFSGSSSFFSYDGDTPTTMPWDDRCGKRIVYYMEMDDGSLYGIDLRYPAFANPVVMVGAGGGEYYYLDCGYASGLTGDYLEGWDGRLSDRRRRDYRLRRQCLLDNYPAQSGACPQSGGRDPSSFSSFVGKGVSRIKAYWKLMDMLAL